MSGGASGAAVLRVQAGAARSAGSYAAGDRPVRRSGRRAGASAAILQPDRPSLDRSRAADPHAAGRLLLRHPLRAAAVRGGPPQPRLPLVLPAGAGRRRPGPLDLLEEPPRPLPRERPAAQAVRDGRRALHGRGPGRRRGLRRRRQPDRRRRQPPARRAGRRRAAAPRPSRAIDEYLAVLDDAAFGAATPVDAEVHLARRSGVPLDRAPRAGRPSTPMRTTT